MAVNKEPILKKCRSLGLDPIYLGINKKSKRWGDAKNGKRGGKKSEYALQLREKQKAKFIYGVLESQFRKYYEQADRMKGVTGTNMLQILEKRLDNVAYRMGIASTRRLARQIVSHAHLTVNGKTIDIPSYIVKPGDVIAVKESRKGNKYFTALKETKNLSIPAWLEFDTEKLEGKVVSEPTREMIDVPVQETLIVELYSK